MKRYIDRQKYSECQLVAAINAAIHLGEPPVRQGSVEYERLVDFVGARYGSACSIHRAFGYLRIWEQKVPLSLRAIRRALAQGKPVGVSVENPKIGGHSILIVDIGDVTPRGKISDTQTIVRVPNFRCATGLWWEPKSQWMPWKDLAKTVSDSSGEFGSRGGGCQGKWVHVFRKQK